MKRRSPTRRTNLVFATATGIALASACASVLGIDDWTPLPESGDEGGASDGKGGSQNQGGSSGSQGNGGSAGTGRGGSGVAAEGGEGGTGGGDTGGTGGSDTGGSDTGGSDTGGRGGTDGKGGKGGSAGMSGNAGMSGSAGSGGCTGTICCQNGTPITSGSCGTNCICTSTGPQETDCKDQIDNDDDGDTDCADSNCLDQLCTTGPTMVSVPVDRDTYVYTALPTMSYGASTRLEVGLGTTARETAFVGVAGLNLDSHVQVSDARLRLYLYGYDDDSIDTLIIELHRAIGAWTETLNWNQAYSGAAFNSAPALFDSTIATELAYEETTGCSGGAVGCVYYNAWYSFNATTIVQAWMAGTDANNGFALTARLNNGNTNIYYFASREYTADTTLRPVLNITYQATCNEQRLCPSP